MRELYTISKAYHLDSITYFINYLYKEVGIDIEKNTLIKQESLKQTQEIYFPQFWGSWGEKIIERIVALQLFWEWFKLGLGMRTDILEQTIKTTNWTLYGIYSGAIETALRMALFIKKWTIDPVGAFIDKVRDFINNVINWVIHVRDYLWGKIKEVWDWLKDTLGYVVNHLRSKLHEVWDDLKAWFRMVWSDLGGALSRIWNWIKDLINNVASGIKKFWDWASSELSTLWDKIKSYFESTWNSITTGVREIWLGLGNFFSDIWDKFVSWVKEIGAKIGKAIWDFLTLFWEYFKWMIFTVLPTAFGMILEFGSKFLGPFVEKFIDVITGGTRGVLSIVGSQPELAPTPSFEFKYDIANAIRPALGSFLSLILAGELVHPLKQIGLPYLSAILYDFAGFSKVVSATWGVLATIAISQPLKYYYLGRYRPYLPFFRDAFTAFSRNLIGDNTFRFFLKYAGIPDRYFEMYQRLGSAPVSPFILRYLSESEILDPQGIFQLAMDRGYDPRKSAYITSALCYASVTSYRKGAESALRAYYQEGFMSSESFEKALSIIRSQRYVNVSYSIPGEVSVSQMVQVPLSPQELLRIQVFYSYLLDAKKDKIATLKKQFVKGWIDLNTFKAKVYDIVPVRERADDIIERAILERQSEPEPEPGIDLRKSLKSVLVRIFKEGFLTQETLERLIDNLNRRVDEKGLILELSRWEKFYDDSLDFLKNEKNRAIDGEITLEELRRNLINYGMRPEKVDLIITDVARTITLKRSKERDQLMNKRLSLRRKISTLERNLQDIENQIKSETDGKKIEMLIRKYDKIVGRIQELNEEIQDIDSALAELQKL
jgi:hypothetical protein